MTSLGLISPPPIAKRDPSEINNSNNKAGRPARDTATSDD